MNKFYFCFAAMLFSLLFILSCADNEESLSAADKLFGVNNKMPETENPISCAVFSEKAVYVDKEKKDAFFCANLGYEYIAKITLADIEEFCQKISSETNYKRICILPLFTDIEQKGFVLFKFDNITLHGYFGTVDRDAGAIVESEWEFIYDMTAKKIEVLKDTD